MSPWHQDISPSETAAMNRRAFLSNTTMGLGSIALSFMLARDTFSAVDEPAWSPPDGLSHIAPKAKSVIWLFMIGGVSHLETFDPKPALNKYAGMSIEETPFKDVLKSPYLENERITAFDKNNGFKRLELFPLQTGFSKRGQCGMEVSDWFKHVGDCADDLAVVRSMWTEDSNHGAQLQFHTGRNKVDGFFPTIGAWTSYGLGSLNENLPRFVVLGNPLADCCGGMEGHRANYLGPQYDGVPLKIDPADPLPYANPDKSVFREEQRAQFEMLNRLNKLTAQQHPDDDAIVARIKSYELAYRMQSAVPDIVSFSGESEATKELYGFNHKTTRAFGEQMLAARRLVEHGVRFVQVFHGSNGGAGGWDAHTKLKTNHTRNCAQTDQPIAALLKDLKQRGLLEETLVVWGSEFGRTPGSQKTDGRDHHPFGFSVWLAGGGIKGGVTHGATDELGYHAVEDRHYVTDLHATVLHQLGLDPRKLEVPGRVRLDRDFGDPMHQIIA